MPDAAADHDDKATTTNTTLPTTIDVSVIIPVWSAVESAADINNTLWSLLADEASQRVSTAPHTNTHYECECILMQDELSRACYDPARDLQPWQSLGLESGFRYRVGVCTCRNRGATHVARHSSQVLVFLDGHVRLHRGCLGQLVSTALQYPRSLVTGGVYVMGNPEVGGSYVGAFTPDLAMDWPRIPENREVSPFPVPICPGTMMAVNRDFFLNELHGFDEGIRLWGFEDIDISLRAWALNPENGVVCNPLARLDHKFRTAVPSGVCSGGDWVYNKMRVAVRHFGWPSSPRLDPPKRISKIVEASEGRDMPYWTNKALSELRSEGEKFSRTITAKGDDVAARFHFTW